ncbi:hypothetical protein G6F54_014347 [Rhizopus delemar]|nr:hypothetical protein G6F54_014347 [Rhizopus delemar]
MRRPVAEAHLERGEPLVQIGLRLVLHRLQVGAVQRGVVDGDLLLGAAAQQLEDGLVHRLAQNIPDGEIDARYRRHRLRSPTGPAPRPAAPGTGR